MSQIIVSSATETRVVSDAGVVLETVHPPGEVYCGGVGGAWFGIDASTGELFKLGPDRTLLWRNGVYGGVVAVGGSLVAMDVQSTGSTLNIYVLDQSTGDVMTTYNVYDPVVGGLQTLPMWSSAGNYVLVFRDTTAYYDTAVVLDAVSGVLTTGYSSIGIDTSGNMYSVWRDDVNGHITKYTGDTILWDISTPGLRVSSQSRSTFRYYAPEDRLYVHDKDTVSKFASADGSAIWSHTFADGDIYSFGLDADGRPYVVLSVYDAGSDTYSPYMTLLNTDTGVPIWSVPSIYGSLFSEADSGFVPFWTQYIKSYEA